MSHTSGPWKFKVVDETDSFLGCKRLDGGGGSTVIDLSNEWDGWPECGQDLQMTISKNDVALIAAAPDMLAALEDILSGWLYIRQVHGDLSGVGWDRAQEKAESAIRKARGEE